MLQLPIKMPDRSEVIIDKNIIWPQVNMGEGHALTFSSYGLSESHDRLVSARPELAEHLPVEYVLRFKRPHAKRDNSPPKKLQIEP